MSGVISQSEQLNCGSQQLFGPAMNTQLGNDAQEMEDKNLMA